MTEIKFIKLSPDASAPRQGTQFSAGFDLTAVSAEHLEGGYVRYGTGLAMEIPEGFAGFLFPRSSCFKNGMSLSNCVGVIDSDYRGEIQCVFRQTDQNKEYHPGDRVAQLIVMPVPAVQFTETDHLSGTDRGEGGFGSTGK